MITRRKYPWIGRQKWEHILFLHWPIQEEKLRPYIPEPFNIDTFEGNAWISLVIFRANESMIRTFPSWLSYRPLYQMNVRTYVFHPQNEERGVYFFSLHVNCRLAAVGARQMFSLPFHYLTIGWQKEAEQIHFIGTSMEGEKIMGSFSPSMTMIVDDLASFLTERYCIWNIHRNKIIKIPIMHTMWQLYEVDVSLNNNALFPLLDGQTDGYQAHYSPVKQSFLYPYETFGFIERS